MMFKTIFAKLVAIFIAILIFSFSVTGTILYFALGNFVTEDKVERLMTSADQINSILKEYLSYMNDSSVRRWFKSILRTSGEMNESLIWVVDRNGQVFFTDSSIPRVISDKLKQGTDEFDFLPDERQYKEVMSGKKEFVKEQGDFYGLFENTGSPWLTIEKPLIVTDNSGKQAVAGAVYMHTPIPEINKARISVFRLFILSVVISIVMGIVLVYIFSLRITKPLKEIKNASRVIANGEFQKRLDVKSKDEIGELANSFNQMAFALQNLEEMRRGFIANVSHELRTPMTSIKGFVEGILDGTIPPEKQQEYLTLVRDEVSRLNKLANDLLVLAKLEAGEMKLSPRDFNINEMLRRCVIKLESLITNKELQVEADFEEEEMFVYADADEIERVIINLLHNAIKFTGENGKINITTVRKKNRIHVSIQDSGVGIDKSETELIWDRFYKSDKSRSRDKSGTGLGLAIVKNIIVEHGQEIWVESETGKGARFTFTLDESDKAQS